MKKQSFFLFALVLAANALAAATITVTGPVAVCPGSQVSYTASAKNLGIAQKGCYAFTFKLNGATVGVGGGITCPCANQEYSKTVNFTWPATGNFEVSVLFTPFNFPCPTYSSGLLTGFVRVVAPEGVFDSNGGLSFCASNQTRTVSVPNIPYNRLEYCYWHHAYDWIVPTGWTVTPVPPFTSQDFQVIPGGIRTHRTSVNVTAPSTPLSQGFTGNYFITVRTEPAWPWPKQITRQIWVGTYGSSLSIAGQSAVCPGNTYTYTATPPGGQQIGTHVYNWTKPSNWTVQTQSVNYITYYVPQNNPDYGVVQVSVNNGCGVTTNGITVFPGYGCGGFLISIYPNPAQEELTVEVANQDFSDKSYPSIGEVSLLSENGELVKSAAKVEDKIKFDTHGLKKGQYFLHVRVGEQIFREQVIIN